MKKNMNRYGIYVIVMAMMVMVTLASTAFGQENKVNIKGATISGRNINTDGDGLVLKGNGDYTLVDCNINAGKNAVVVSDNATVTIKNCGLQGIKSAILIKNHGTVKASNSVFNGKIKKLDNADFIDKGGNVINNY